jgi:hypothetical protein
MIFPVLCDGPARAKKYRDQYATVSSAEFLSDPI